MPVNPIPKGYHTITPFPCVKDASRLIDFLKAAFEATERYRMPTPEGKLMHAEIKIGDSIIMLSDKICDEMDYTPSVYYLYVRDADLTYKQAVKAGGESIQEPEDQFWGDRAAAIKDPSGNIWWMATHIEDVDPQEMSRRADKAMKEMAADK